MNYLVVIGNGFDRAHKLKTSYEHFMEYLYNEQIKNKTFEPALFNPNSELPQTLEEYKQRHSKRNSIRPIIGYSNIFFKDLFSSFQNQNWCDIEEFYYKELLKTKGTNNPKKLNNEFEEIKIHLNNYLIHIQYNSHFNPIPKIQEFFAFINSQNTLILNFNYTNTLESYEGELSNTITNSIHGALQDGLNPMIFGYAVNDKEAKGLISKGNKEYLRNVKKFCYMRSNKEKQLLQFLGNSKEIIAIFLGHSCGASDDQILNEICNHDNVQELINLYHNDYENFFNFQSNMFSVINDTKNYSKLRNFQDSIPMPQYNMSHFDETRFKKFLTKLPKKK